MMVVDTQEGEDSTAAMNWAAWVDSPSLQKPLPALPRHMREGWKRSLEDVGELRPPSRSVYSASDVDPTQPQAMLEDLANVSPSESLKLGHTELPGTAM